MTRILSVSHDDEPSLFAGDVLKSYQFVCGACSGPILSPSDHVVFELTERDVPAQFEFVHKRCDQNPSGTRYMAISTLLGNLRELGTFEPIRA